MSIKKRIIFGFLILLIFVIAIFLFSGGKDMFLKKSPANLSEIIEQEKIDDLSLTIYCISPSILTRAPLSVEDLISFNNVQKIVIDGSNLGEYSNLLNKLSNADLIPVENKSRINARIYYVFETMEDGKIFDVAMWGDNSIFVNGVEAEVDKIFYEILIPFLPEDAIEESRGWLWGEVY